MKDDNVIQKTIFYIFFLCFFLLNEANAFLLNQEEIDELKENPSLISSFFDIKKDKLIFEFGENYLYLNDDELYVIFCSIIAHRLSPYGYSCVTDLYSLLSEPHLNCGNYGLLTTKLAEFGDRGILNKVVIHFVGWEGGAFGNHQTLFITNAKPTGIFLDPTTGLVAFCSFNEVASGHKVDHEQIVDFCYWQNIQNYKNRIKNALQLGLCKPSDLLYYYANSDGFLYSCTDGKGFIINPDTTLWMTPAGQKRYFR